MHFIKTLFIISVLVFSYCGAQKSRQQAKSLEQTQPDTNHNISDSLNHLSIELLQKHTTSKENTILSGYSIYSALALTYAGSAGLTKKEMASSLHYPADASLLHKQMKNKQHQLLSTIDTNQSIAIKNMIIYDSAFSLLPTYLKTISDYYDITPEKINFKKSKERDKARQQINKQIKEVTNGNIKELIPPQALSPLSKMVIANALYFKSPWQTPFAEKATTKQKFFYLPDSSILTPFMKQSSKLPYFKNKQVELVSIPFQSGQYYFHILIPRYTYTPSQFLDEHTADELIQLFDSTRHKHIDLQLPKFGFQSKFQLAKTLKMMGMNNAFNEKANFKKLNGRKNLFIDNIFHEATIDINENGAEASAATAAVMAVKSAPAEKISVRVNQPFLFFIQEKQTKILLFQGQIIKPTTK